MQAPELLKQFKRIVVYALGAAVAGVIGNKTDASLPNILPFLDEPAQTKRWIFLLVAIAIIVPLTWFLIRYSAALSISTALNQIDESLFRALPTLYGSSSSQEATQVARQANIRLFKQVISIKPFRKCGIIIYRPNVDETLLHPWLHYSRPNEADPNLTFNISDISKRNNASGGQGDQGRTYLTSETRIIHIRQDGRTAVDSSDYFCPVQGGAVDYRSFICTVIPGITSKKKLGVLCLYSRNYNTFDSIAAKEFIEAIAQRLSSVLDVLKV